MPNGKPGRVILVAMTVALVACEGEVALQPGGCDVAAPLPAGGIAAADTSATPRAHAAAELLAMEASGEFMAPAALYERVAADLAALGGGSTSEPESLQFGCGVVTEIIVGMTEAGVAQVDAGQYTAWDEYNQALHLTERRALASGGYVLHFDGIYNHATLAQAYAELPEVRYAERNAIVGISSDLCLEALPDGTNVYISAIGFNDCQSGCLDAAYDGYARDANGAVEFLGSFERGDPAPRWYTDAARCRSFLDL